VAGTTGTIELRATYPNTDMKLVPGQLVDTTVVLSNIPHATLVPREAVNTGPDGLYVYVVKDGMADQRTVKLEFDDGVNDAISGDIKAGDVVVTDGQLRVLPGARVSISGIKKHAGAGAGAHHKGKHSSTTEG